MKNLRWITLMIALLILLLNDAAWGHSRHGHRHHHFNWSIGIGGYNPGFYGYRDPFFYRRFYNYPRTVVVPATPPVYIERQNPVPVQPQINYWHYCRNPEGYYPYVANCPGGWMQVPSQPPS